MTEAAPALGIQFDLKSSSGADPKCRLTLPLLLDPLDPAQAPGFVEPRFQRDVQADDDTPGSRPGGTGMLPP